MDMFKLLDMYCQTALQTDCMSMWILKVPLSTWKTLLGPLNVCTLLSYNVASIEKQIYNAQ